MITISSYTITTSNDNRPVGVHGVPTFEQAKLTCRVHMATQENRDSVLSVRDNNGTLTAVYMGSAADMLVIDRKVWSRADYAEGFDLDEWDGIWVNELPYSPARTATIVEGPKLREEDLTQYPFSLDGFLDNPFPARDLYGNWYLVK